MSGDRIPYEITAHALERFEERFPDEAHGSDRAMAMLIQREVEEALAAGRVSHVLPREFWTIRRVRQMRHVPQEVNDRAKLPPHGEFCWPPGKRRCYSIEDTGSVIYVRTVLRGVRDRPTDSSPSPQPQTAERSVH